MGAAGGGRVGREKAIVSGSGNSDRRGYMGGAGETESVLVAFFFFFSVLISFQEIFCWFPAKKLSFPLLEASRDQSKHFIQSVWSYGQFF